MCEYAHILLIFQRIFVRKVVVCEWLTVLVFNGVE